MPEDTLPEETLPITGYTAKYDPSMTNAELKEASGMWGALDRAGFESLATKRALLTGDFDKWGGIDEFLVKEGKVNKLKQIGAKFFSKLGFDSAQAEQIFGRPVATDAKFAGQSMADIKGTYPWQVLTDAGFAGDEAKYAILTGDYAGYGSMENFLSKEGRRKKIKGLSANFFNKLGLDPEMAFAQILRQEPPPGGDFDPTLPPGTPGGPPGGGMQPPGTPIEPGDYPGGYDQSGAVPVQQPAPQPGPAGQIRYSPNYLPQPEWAQQSAQADALRLPESPTLPPPVYGQNQPGTPYQPAQAPTGTPVAGRTGGATANAQPTITQAQQDAAIQAAILAATQNQPIPGK